MGDHLLAVLVYEIANLIHLRNVESELGMVNLLLKYCSASEAFRHLRYKRRKGVEFAPASLLHCAISRSGFITLPHPPVLFSRLIRAGVDLELADKNGNTPLLYSLFYHPLFTATSFLFDAGADLRATNKYGENGLHLLCRRLSACSVQQPEEYEKGRIISFLARLLQGGLDPVAGNEVGWTPIDAAMSPVAWAYLCKAMRQVGRNMRDEVRRLDLAVDIELSEAEIQKKLSETMEQASSPAEDVNYSTPSDPGGCYLCNESLIRPLYRQPPFDEFYSKVARELDHHIHMMLYNHPCEGECLEVLEEDSCFTLDYFPAKMSQERLKERSWRRHVAAILEERGFLSHY